MSEKGHDPEKMTDSRQLSAVNDAEDCEVANGQDPEDVDQGKDRGNDVSVHKIIYSGLSLEASVGFRNFLFFTEQKHCKDLKPSLNQCLDPCQPPRVSVKF